MAKIETEFFKRKARIDHVCSVCGGTINAGDVYYQQGPIERFLESLHAKRICLRCYENGNFGSKASQIPKEQKRLLD
jgi:hypothetical protein